MEELQNSCENVSNNVLTDEVCLCLLVVKSCLCKLNVPVAEDVGGNVLVLAVVVVGGIVFVLAVVLVGGIVFVLAVVLVGAILVVVAA